MTKIVVVPDLHLQGRLVLPAIEMELIKARAKVDLFLFLGDYFDQYDVSDYKLSKAEADYLLTFASTHPCKFLLGNHDIPYLINDIEAYSDFSSKIQMYYQMTLAKMNVSLAYQDRDYLFTHAGQTAGKLSNRDFEVINDDNFDMYLDYLHQVQQQASPASGGMSKNPSCVWARPEDWSDEYNPNYVCQVVGHTPMKQISKVISFKDPNRSIIFSDTFSLATMQTNHGIDYK